MDLTGVGRWVLMCASWLAVAVVSGGVAAAQGVSLGGDAADERFVYFEGVEHADGVPAPREVLGHGIGEAFTRHDRLLAYCGVLAESSDRVRVEQYGQSHQGRPLVILTISSEENMARLGEILAANRELANPSTGEGRAREIIENNPAVVWYSFSVHGNEASCSEAALRFAYELAAGEHERIDAILDDTVVVIDPLLNPDGRERYLSWYQNTRGVRPIADVDAAEHHEPWPTGRSNHYLFDLNRDWVWMVHPESRSRVAAYREYLPQLHLDYHEQGYRSPYFFGAGDTPYNSHIPESTRDWLRVYGEGNAEAFDARGLVYATEERFDYLYPGYGKVLPCYHGAVGLLLEQAGHGRAGLAIEVGGDYVLTLEERAHHHFLTAMNYLDVTQRNREGQLERFRGYFVESMEVPEGQPHAFLIDARTDPALLELVWSFCEGHGIEVRALEDEAEFERLHGYFDGMEHEDVTLPAGSWVIPSGQPMGRLVRAMFERSSFLEDIDTYDITGWSLPVSFGLDAWWSEREVRASTEALGSWSRPAARLSGTGSVALLVDSGQHRFPVAVGIARDLDLFARMLGEAVELDGVRFERGSLLLHRVRNDVGDLEAFVERALDAGLDVHRTGSGMTESGHVLGANAHPLAELPRVMLLRGEPLSSYSVGHHWHLLDIAQPVPYVPVNVEDLRGVEMSDYDVVLIPEAWGSLSDALGESTIEALDRWVRGGGTVVASGESADWVQRELMGLEPREDDTPGGPAEEEPYEDEEVFPPLYELSYEEREARGVEDRISGAMTRAEIDTSHPIAGGVGEWVGVLKRSKRTLLLADDGFAVARFSTDPVVGGAISERNAEAIGGEPFMTYHRHGRGSVVLFSDDQTVRGFNHAGMRLLMNAVVLAPTF